MAAVHALLKAAGYQPYYCEENAWQLCAALGEASHSAEVWVISNAAGCVAVWGQRLSKDPSLPVTWDYHVVVCVYGNGAPALVIDRDARDGPLAPAHVWLQRSFPAGSFDLLTRAGIQPPQFRVIAAPAYIEQFASDRRHMRDTHGNFLHPPPSWPCIQSGGNESHRLPELLDFSGETSNPTSSDISWPGALLSLATLGQRIDDRPARSRATGRDAAG